MPPLPPDVLDHDLHCHLLPGVDDGSRTPAESLAMARGLAALGVRRLHVTPHQFRFGLRWEAEEVARRTAEVQAQLDHAGIELVLVPAAEHLYGEELLGALETGAGCLPVTLPTHAPDEPGRRALLVELPLRDPVVGVETVARLILDRGWTPVLAHPERVLSVIDQPLRVEGWRQAGWELQLDLLSVAGTYGPLVQRTAQALLEVRAYRWVGSDLHRASQLADLGEAHAALRTRLRAAPAGGVR